MGCYEAAADAPAPPGARLVRPRDAAFPPALLDANPRVRALWTVGADPRSLGPMIAIVGTRRPTPYGLEVARTLAMDLAALGFCIVSGMARGIDAAAHEGALRAGGRTVAVLGSGVDVPYPEENEELYRRIAASGAILAEVPPGADPRKEHFPARNRIIVALSAGVVIVQGLVARSGAMRTAQWAHEMDRELFAVPGDVRAAMSSGPHAILREGWGHVCTCAADVVNVVGPALGWERAGRDEVVVPSHLPPAQRAALAALGDGEATVETLAARALIPAEEAARALAELELEALVVKTVSGTYQAVQARERSAPGERASGRG